MPIGERQQSPGKSGLPARLTFSVLLTGEGSFGSASESYYSTDLSLQLNERVQPLESESLRSCDHLFFKTQGSSEFLQPSGLRRFWRFQDT